MLVLGIESTCDETAAAVVKKGKKILSNVIASQIPLHQPYGGVFPELASRSHIDAITPVITSAIEQAGIQKKDIDLISVAKGPGLIGSLLIGMNAAKGLSLALNKPFVGINHVEAHLYAAMMHQETIKFPALGVVVSGGHTFLVKITDIGSYTLLGTTIDDAIGEAFDKVAVMLDLPYPGGPQIEYLAQFGNSHRFSFKAGQVKQRPLDFSFSGLKTNIYYTIQENKNLSDQDKADIAASFQYSAFSDLVKKCILALQTEPFQAIYLGGGVSNNQYLRLMLSKSSPIPVYYPEKGLSLDNAAMIAGLGYHVFLKNKADLLSLEPQTRIPLPQ